MSFPTAAISFTSFAETFHDPAVSASAGAALPSTVRLCSSAVVFVAKSAVSALYNSASAIAVHVNPAGLPVALEFTTRILTNTPLVGAKSYLYSFTPLLSCCAIVSVVSTNVHVSAAPVSDTKICVVFASGYVAE